MERQNIIDFVKQTSPLDDDCIRLLSVLGDEYPTDAIAREVSQRWADCVKVMLDGRLLGILILKCQYNYKGERLLLVHHGVSEENMRGEFTKILSEYIFPYAAQQGFAEVHQHADTLSLKRLYEKYYGDANEWIFKKDIRQWAKAHQAQAAAKQQLPPTNL